MRGWIYLSEVQSQLGKTTRLSLAPSSGAAPSLDERQTQTLRPRCHRHRKRRGRLRRFDWVCVFSMRLSWGAASSLPILCADSETFGITVHPMAATATQRSKRRRYTAVIVVCFRQGPPSGQQLSQSLRARPASSCPDALSSAFSDRKRIRQPLPRGRFRFPGTGFADQASIEVSPDRYLVHLIDEGSDIDLVIFHEIVLAMIHFDGQSRLLRCQP